MEFNHKPAKFYCPKQEKEESTLPPPHPHPPPPPPNLSQVYGVDWQHGEADSNFLKCRPFSTHFIPFCLTHYSSKPLNQSMSFKPPHGWQNSLAAPTHTHTRTHARTHAHTMLAILLSWLLIAGTLSVHSYIILSTVPVVRQEIRDGASHEQAINMQSSKSRDVCVLSRLRTRDCEINLDHFTDHHGCNDFLLNVSTSFPTVTVIVVLWYRI